jgi:lauroyl/myristoyl acyltransferase
MTPAVEAAARGAPDHRSWIHRRWRTGPERGINIYQQSSCRAEHAG